MRHTPDNITELAPNGIFVFGSNTKGVHGSGAAKKAARHFGAQRGIGEGLTGQCYALPTLNADSRGGFHLEKRTDYELLGSIFEFYCCVADNPRYTSLLTKVGCGLAGYDEAHIIDLFHKVSVRFNGSLANIVWPEGWQ